ncbi:ABC transporter F family member 4 [Aedes albopictus]|uniref:Transcriptional regulator atrx n=1 Tax=Aedes albopictus TaxID=7160 RepID=A0ABM1ZSS2_AEDAL
MPTQKNKLKKSKPDPPAALLVNPVQIKAEPLDIKPLGAFVDDRVELIRQAFSCLKPKEVKCLVPDSLQGKSIESLQEQCLDEVLGISTKRLLSIINSTKCPTDTESSSDEDEKIVEHISLDEISSDSEVEMAKPAAKKTKSKDVKSKKDKEPDVKQNDKPKDKPNKNGGKKSEKEMTVLELLELQARARAIRSQLALEPVTKIELDSDQDGETTSDTEKTTKKPNDSKAKPDNTNSTKQSKKSPPKEQSKRVRLKRNFRIRQVGDEDLPEEPAQKSSPEQRTVRKSRSKSKEKEPEPKPLVDEPAKPKEEAQAPKSRDSSPEVIPVIPSPETLCISSDSEDEKAKKAKSSIFVDNIEELEKQLKEKQTPATPKKSDHKDEPEEGELTEEDKSPQRNRKESVKSIGANSEPAVVESPKKLTSLEQEEELDYEVREISDSEPETSNQAKDDSTKTEEAEEKVQQADGNNESDESEPESESSEEEIKPTSSSDDDDDHDPDVVEIHDSSDETLLEQKLAEDETEKSWGSRWLESKRVAKVMAASRLGNKVRDKLKKKKQKEQQEQQELEKEAEKAESPEPPKEPELPSNVEEGSVEHYKELVAKAGGADVTLKNATNTPAENDN